MGAETGFFLGEGGVVIEMNLPLPEVMADKVTKSLIRRVNEDGSPYEGDAATPAEGAAVTTRPGDSALKPAWVGWAVACGAKPDDAEAATKADLIETYGQQTPTPEEGS